LLCSAGLQSSWASMPQNTMERSSCLAGVDQELLHDLHMSSSTQRVSQSRPLTKTHAQQGQQQEAPASNANSAWPRLLQLQNGKRRRWEAATCHTYI
jgi:hypothetical protein